MVRRVKQPTMTLALAAGLCRDAGNRTASAAALIDEAAGGGGVVLADVSSSLVGAVRFLEQARTAEAQALQTVVDALRESGMTWDDIGKHFGTSRQAAWQRFGRGRRAAR